MSGHTPGPWYVHELGQHWNNPKLKHIEICYGKDDECICDTVYEDADARLIAAAPDLLDALELVLGAIPEGWEVPMFYNEICAQARAAIARAEGKS